MCDITDESDLSATLLPCPTCLTYGRAMWPLCDAARIYTMLLTGVQQQSDDSELYMRCVRVCWECHGTLNRILKFQGQVLEANGLLQGAFQNMEETEKLTYSLSRLSCDTSVGYDYELQCTLEGEEGQEGWEGAVSAERLADVKLEVGPMMEGDIEEQKSSSGEEADKIPIQLLVRKRKKRQVEKQKNHRHRADTIREGKRVILKGGNKHVKIVSVTMSEEEMLKYREEDRGSAHYADAAYKCQKCVKGFFLDAALKRHNDTYHNQDIGSYHCEICDSYFADIDQKLGHHKRHYTMFVCSACGFTHRYLAPVVKHYDQAHHSGSGYPCDDCHLVFTSHRQRRYHHDAVHRELYKCEYCGRLMSSAQSLKVHLLTHTGMPLVECSECHKTFRGESSLATHLRQSHRQPDADGAYCHECNLQFKNRSNYLSHMKRSEKHAAPGQLRFSCPQCGKRFLSASEMRQHVKRYHGETSCLICNKTLKNLHSLDNHMKNVHEKRKVPKRHICELCGKAFTTRGQLKNHHVTHTGERAHACDVCGATFGHRSTMRTHRKLIHLKQYATRLPDEYVQQQY